MSIQLLLALGVGALVAYVNGANDVSKGIATLVGSGVSDYRRAIRWGTAWTALGGIAGALFASSMVAAFGRGLLTAETTSTFAAALATIVGAALWVLVATRTGLPVSTTHAIVGSLSGVAAIAYGLGGVRWNALAGKIALPLLLSPLVSMVVTLALLRWARALERRASIAPDCVCVEVAAAAPAQVAVCADGHAVALATPPVAGALDVQLGTSERCAVERPAALRLTLDHLHWLTSGATSFARAMNDAPKMVALVLGASALAAGPRLPPWLAFSVVTAGMVAGSLVGGRRVTSVLAEKITRLDHREGFVANIVTSVLVIAGAVGGLPMSTTHVSSTGIMAAGMTRGPGALDRRTIRDLLLAWVVTLPLAAALGMVSFAAVRGVLRVG